MAKTKKTVILPEELLERALKASGENITQTICLGLKLVAAKEVYKKMRNARGTYKSTLDLSALREDR